MVKPAIFLLSTALSAAAATTNDSGAVTALVGARPFTITSNRTDYTEFLNPTNVEKLVVKHPPEEIAFNLNGETMTWGRVDRYVDMQMKTYRINLPAGATADEIAAAVTSTRAKMAERAINGYLRNALAAQLARKLNISLSPEETEKFLAESKKRMPSAKLQEAAPELADPESFYRRDFENFHLTLKYRDQVITNAIEVAPAEIAAEIAKREAEIAAANATNRTLRPIMEKWLKELREGKRDFGETAAEFSDCGSACDEGVMGEYERDGTLLPVLENFAFTTPTNQLSDVLETPYSFHIMKVLEQKFDPDAENDADGASKEGEPTSVILAQIMLEKQEVPEKLDEAKAEQELRGRKTAAALAKAQREALAAAKLECSVQVTLLRKGNQSGNKRSKK